MKALKQYFLIALLGAAVMAGCRSDDDAPCCDATNPECPNYDPCHDKNEPSARFLIEDRLIWPEFGEFLWIHDSILRGGPVQFRTAFDSPEISHMWYIGSQTFDTPSVIRNFSAVERPSLITISHVITYPIDSLCYPEATGRDSMAQTFYLIDFLSELLTIESTFRGVVNNESDSFEFKIRCLEVNTGVPAQISTSGWQWTGINFHNNQDSMIFPSSSATNTHFAIHNPDLQGALLVINPDDMSVQMNYKFFFDPTEYTFMGRVLQE